jgi:hypothetical protein
MALMIKNVFEFFILALLMVLRVRCVVLSISYAVADENPQKCSTSTTFLIPARTRDADHQQENPWNTLKWNFEGFGRAWCKLVVASSDRNDG